MKKFPRWGRLGAGIVLALSLYPAYWLWSLLMPCTNGAVQIFVLVICAGMGFYLLAGGRSRWLLAGAVMLVLLATWMGSYPLEQFRPPVLLGFQTITKTHGSVRILPGAVMTLAAGQVTALEAITSMDAHCNWMSAQGGAFDDPQSCATVYVPPRRVSDIVRVSIQPTCGLPSVMGQLKISILLP